MSERRVKKPSQKWVKERDAGEKGRRERGEKDKGPDWHYFFHLQP